MESGKIALGVLVGLATGVVLGILFAPNKGSSTRKRILEKGKSYANGVKEDINEFSQNIADKYENIIKEAKDMAREK